MKTETISSRFLSEATDQLSSRFLYEATGPRFRIPGILALKNQPGHSLQIAQRETRIAKILDRFDAAKDYYAILGASKTASRRDIERLYKRLARKHHPDRGGVEAEMKSLNEAYRVLHDDIAREQYDSQRLRPGSSNVIIQSAPAAREVGVYGQLLSSMLCVTSGLMLLILWRFNGLW